MIETKPEAQTVLTPGEQKDLKDATRALATIKIEEFTLHEGARLGKLTQEIILAETDSYKGRVVYKLTKEGLRKKIGTGPDFDPNSYAELAQLLLDANPQLKSADVGTFLEQKVDEVTQAAG